MAVQLRDVSSLGAARVPRRSTSIDNRFFGHLLFNQKNDHWNSAIKTKMNTLCGLPAGWDGYNGIATRFDVAQFAVSLLERIYGENTPLPDIVPLADGGVQIEWHVDNLDIEIAIYKPLCATVWVEDNNGGVELDLTNDFSDLLPWVDRLG